MDDKPGRYRRTPGDAKRLSYERDCVSLYGENDKAARKAIPRFKAASNRVERHAEGVALRQAVALGVRTDEEFAPMETAVAEARFQGRHPWKCKVADIPLGFALDNRRDSGGRDARPQANLRAAVAKALRIKASFGFG